MVVSSILLTLCVAVAIYFAIRIKASDIHVYTHYTSYGSTNFYASSWLYALGYPLFFLIVGLANTAIAAKLYNLKDRRFAVCFLWFSIGVALLALVNFTHIVKVAFPL